jgi:hypothetical protein
MKTLDETVTYRMQTTATMDDPFSVTIFYACIYVAWLLILRYRHSNFLVLPERLVNLFYKGYKEYCIVKPMFRQASKN